MDQSSSSFYSQQRWETAAADFTFMTNPHPIMGKNSQEARNIFQSSTSFLSSRGGACKDYKLA